jgi:17beta-estradiol 17-dehydrogenase / very-long-chain 3-oxoacyl-CoA reductase
MALIYSYLGIPAKFVGAFILARWGYHLGLNLVFFLRGSGVHRYLEDGPGANRDKIKQSWAMVTGSSSGLGRALAFDLAGRGFNIVLHGSKESKLRGVQNDLQATHPSALVRIIVLDARDLILLEPHDLAVKLEGIARSLRDIKLRIVINNLGMPQARPELRAPFDKIDSFTYDELLQNASGNALFPLLLTRALYPQLVQHQPALIMSIGSTLAGMGAPLFPSYGPAKAFVMTSAAELRLENIIEGRDIEVLGIDVLGFTGTDTIKSKPSIMIPDARTYARAVVGSIGCGYPRATPYLPHALFLWVVENFPAWVRERFLVSTMRSMRQEAVDCLNGTTVSKNKAV